MMFATSSAILRPSYVFKVLMFLCRLNICLCLVVFTYLALFRLDELGIDVFCKLVQSQDTNKMYRVSMRSGNSLSELLFTILPPGEWSALGSVCLSTGVTQKLLRRCTHFFVFHNKSILMARPSSNVTWIGIRIWTPELILKRIHQHCKIGPKIAYQTLYWHQMCIIVKKCITTLKVQHSERGTGISDCLVWYYISVLMMLWC